ncbi:hypothetical protein FEM48_ZijujUnG0013600 [Ziziphus jujuba var. spinosa]|uniref:Uncharacterized protein n=1 Tax=Ziziphus jujuba var. spinosa TaxID=714518 RepID=A0A978U9X7_ZIZJJ|nr:hypothetical protein FEM48_ZijujUnG0013600 [Ziziphus jujuba var. spinosa]
MLLQLLQELYGSHPRRDFRMTVSRNSTRIRAAIAVDLVDPTKRFRLNCRKWAIHNKSLLSNGFLRGPAYGPVSSTKEFGLRGQPGSFYEEGGAKEARGLVKEGGKGIRRGGVPRQNKGMKGHFALKTLYAPHNDGSIVLGSVEACFFSKVFLVINMTYP